MACARSGVVSGYPDGLYRPAAVVLRDQMAVFITRFIVDPTGDEGLADYTPPTEPSFHDVRTDHWSDKHVEYLADAGVVTGYPDGLYRPDSAVTRDQMPIYIARAFDLM